jgi:hypothetical protein
VALKEIHHRRSSGEERLNIGRIVVVSQFVPEIGTRKFQIFDDTIGLGQRITGNLHPPPRAGGRSPASRVLSNHNDLQSVTGSRDRSR